MASDPGIFSPPLGQCVRGVGELSWPARRRGVLGRVVGPAAVGGGAPRLGLGGGCVNLGWRRGAWVWCEIGREVWRRGIVCPVCVVE